MRVTARVVASLPEGFRHVGKLKRRSASNTESESGHSCRPQKGNLLYTTVSADLLKISQQ